MQNKDKLEYHVPDHFTRERPAINFSHESFDISITQHPQGSELPSPASSPNFSHPMHGYRSFLIPEKTPIELRQWLSSDLAPICFHAISFIDATIVTLTWPHALFDMMGLRCVLTAWVAVLDGREQDVPEFWGYDFDPMRNLGSLEHGPNSREYPDKNNVLQGRILSGWGLFRFALGYFWDLFVHREEEMRVVVLPAPFVRSLREEALNDVSSVSPANIVMDTSDDTQKRPFLSNGDILCAWWMRQIVSSQPWIASAKPTKTIHIMNILEMRDILINTDPRLISKGASFVGNCITPIHSFFSLSELLSQPLGLIAARIRSDLVTQSTRPQVEAAVHLTKATLARTGNPPLYGDADMIICPFSNWTKCSLFETDFSAAIIMEGKCDRAIGRPTCILGDATLRGFSARNSANVTGMDALGNWWIGSTLRTETWMNIRRAMEGLEYT